MSTPKIITEVAVFTPESAIIAANAGADRIELCSGYTEGGLSPAASTIKLVRNKVTCKLHVMIRPRIGDFVYSEFEKEIILHEIAFCKSLEVDGVVVGALTHHAQIDTQFMQEVVEKATPMSVTFHRAFDLTSDLLKSMKELIACNVNRILTSGGKSNVIDGLFVLENLVKQANGQIIILPGGGITPENILELVCQTKVSEVHFSGKKSTKSPMNAISSVSLTSKTSTDDFHWFECDETIIDSIKNKLSKV